MKNLRESLFDADLVTKDVCYGDVYDVEQWGGSTQDIEEFPHLLGTYVSAGRLDAVLARDSAWKKFLKWEHPKIWKPSHYLYSEYLYKFTRIIMSCSNENEVLEKLNEIMQSCPNLRNVGGPGNFHKKQPIYVNQVNALTQPRSNSIRMIVLKFKLKDSDHPFRDFVLWLTLRPKED